MQGPVIIHVHTATRTHRASIILYNSGDGGSWGGLLHCQINHSSNFAIIRFELFKRMRIRITCYRGSYWQKSYGIRHAMIAIHTRLYENIYRSIIYIFAGKTGLSTWQKGGEDRHSCSRDVLTSLQVHVHLPLPRLAAC